MDLRAPPISQTLRGLVISDLHVFARRSIWTARLESIASELKTVDRLVLNGDTFDFRWSTASRQATHEKAIAWLRQMVNDLPHCQIHWLAGNHDCQQDFWDQLVAFCREHPRFQCHQTHLILGQAIFLHGDCTLRQMNLEGLRRYRAGWQDDQPHSRAAHAVYRLADCLGLTMLIHHTCFPRKAVVRRLAYFLDQVQPDWRGPIRHCYFGHTHLPFAHHEFQGVRYHNTGSAIHGMEFSPCRFEITQTEPSLLTTAIP